MRYYQRIFIFFVCFFVVNQFLSATLSFQAISSEEFNFQKLQKIFYVNDKSSAELILRGILVMQEDSQGSLDNSLKNVAIWTLFWNGLILPGIKPCPKNRFFFRIGDFLNSLIKLFTSSNPELLDIKIEDAPLQQLIPSPSTAFSSFPRKDFVFYEELTRSDFFINPNMNFGIWRNFDDHEDDGIRKISKLNLFICLARLIENLRCLKDRKYLRIDVIKLIKTLNDQIFTNRAQFDNEVPDGYFLAKNEWMLLLHSLE